jgi:RHS repeat-associated protein
MYSLATRIVHSILPRNSSRLALLKASLACLSSLFAKHSSRVSVCLLVGFSLAGVDSAMWDGAEAAGDQVGSTGKDDGKTAGDPVVLSSGVFTLSETDLQIAGRGMDFTFTRNYNSGSTRNGVMGSKWDHNWNQFIVLDYKVVPNPTYTGPEDQVLGWTNIGNQVSKVLEDPLSQAIQDGWSVYQVPDPLSARQDYAGSYNLDPSIWNLNLNAAYYYDGANGIDVFTKAPATGPISFLESGVGLWDSPRGYTSKLIGNPLPGQSSGLPLNFQMRTSEGLIYTFGEVDTKDPYIVGRIYRLSRIEDPDGNSMTASYATISVTNDSYPNSTNYKVVDKVTDTYGREIQFGHSAHWSAGKVVRNTLTSVTDYAGNQVKFTYGGNPPAGVYLETVRSPRVLGTPTGNDFPNGSETYYGYQVSEQWTPTIGGSRLPSSISPLLTSIVNPNEYQGGTGSLTPYLRNEYSGGKVVRQWLGETNSSGIPSGGLFRFLYAPTSNGQPVYHGNGITELSRTLVVDPNGGVSLTIFDGAGQDVLAWDFTGRVDPELIGSISGIVSVDPANPDGNLDHIQSSAPGYSPPLRAGEPSSYVTRKYFDSDGRVTEVINPGSHYRYTYYSGPDDFQRKKVIVHEQLPVPDDGSDPLLSINVFEPFRGRLRASYPPISFDPNHIPANGGITGADPERYSTKYLFDYQEGDIDGSALDTNAANWGIDVDQASLSSVYSQYGISHIPVKLDDQKGELNGDNSTVQRIGRLIKTVGPTANIWGDPTSSVPSFVPQVVESKTIYNAYGLPMTRIDERGNATNYFYFSAIDPDGDGVPVAGSGDSNTGQFGGGFKEREVSAAGVVFESAYDSMCRQVGTTYYRGTTAIFTSKVFNAHGNLIQETNDVGEVEQYIYDSTGNLVHQRIENRLPETDSGGSLTGAIVAAASGGFIDQYYEYDIQGNLVQEDIQVDAQTRSITKHRYDKMGNLAITLNPMRSSGDPHNYTTNVYDELGRLWSTSRGGRTSEFNGLLADGDIPERGGLTNSPDASTTFNHYNALGNLVKSVDGEGKEKTLTVDSFGRVIRQTDPLGNYTRYILDAAGHQLEIFSHDDSGSMLAHTKMSYDELGRAFQTDGKLFQIGATSAPLFEGPLTPADGFVTTRVLFDAVGNAVQVVDDDGGSLYQVYDADWQLTSHKDSRGNETLYGYDNVGNTNRIERREVDDAGLLKNTTVSWSFYDSGNQLVATLDSLGNVRRFAYDSRGLLIYESDARSDLTTSNVSSLDTYGEHADLGTVSSINLEGNTTIYEHDDRGLITGTKSYFRTDGVGGQTIDTAAGGDGVVTLLNSFDLNGRIRTRTDDAGKVSTYEYDALNRLVKTIRADQSESTVSYDKRGRVATEVTPRGDSVVSICDDAARVVLRTITYATSGLVEAESFTYDGLDRVILAINSEASVGRYYDSLGRLVRETINGDVTEMGYNGTGGLVSLKYPSGRLIDRSFDTSGLLTDISEQNAPAWSVEFDYEGGKLDALRYGNGTEAIIDYDSIGRPTQYLVQDSATSTAIENRSREWDANSNVSARVDNSRNRRFEYEYDSLNRLVESNRGDGVTVNATTTYSLDGSGNRVSVAGGISNGLTSMLPAASFASVNKYSNSPPYADIQYDLNGNLTQRLEGSYADFEYDYRNLTTKFVDLGTGATWTYGYDAFGRRVNKSSSSAGTINYRYAGPELCEEQDGISSTTSTYVYGGAIDELLSVRRGTVDTFYHGDFQGNILAITDALGQVLEQYEYDDFGLVRNASDLTLLTGVGVSGNTHYYTGRPFDWESQLYYVRTRMLDPRLGRFTTRDSLGGWADPLSLGNGYTYCGNNPWTFIDPMGTKAKQGKRKRGAVKGPWAKVRLNAARRKARAALRDLGAAATEEIRTALQDGREPNFNDALAEFFANKPAELKVKKSFTYGELITKGPNGEPLEIPILPVTGFDLSLSFAIEVELPAKSKSQPPTAAAQGDSGSGGGETGSALIEAAWGLAASFIPGVGEAQDIAMLISSEASWVDRTLAGVSLVASVFTAGAAPNYAAVKAGIGMGALLGTIGRSGDELADLARAAKAAKAAKRAIPFEGFTKWGSDLWNSGEKGAREALRGMTPALARKIDPVKARQALDFYKEAAANGRGGRAAPIRVKLMRRILKLQE